MISRTNSTLVNSANAVILTERARDKGSSARLHFYRICTPKIVFCQSRTKCPFFRPSNSHGAAIVIVLAFVVLLTSIVLAFFSRAIDQRQISNSSASQMRADILAKGALETLIGDLKQEIAAGSVIATQNNVSIFNPTNRTIRPCLAGAHPDMPNLIKRSTDGVPFFSGADYNTANFSPANRSSNVESTEPSVNNRVITPARWNKARLLPSLVAEGSPTPNPATWVPHWVMVSREGSNPTSWHIDLRNFQSSRFVTGRYAYAIYNVGDLLDINVAGYPTGVSSSEAAKKGVLALADLTQIPGVTQSLVDRLVGWRNYATAEVTGSFPNFTSFSEARYLNFIRSSSTAFIRVSNTVHNSKTDQPLLSRHALLNFSRAIGLPENALQNLTTFTRELNAPSWGPTVNASSLGGNGNVLYAYKENRENVASVNRNIPTVRAPSDATITDFRTDGSSYTYPVRSGESLIRRRFPLGRLSWIGRSGPQNGGGAQNIQACFGLSWNNTSQRWNYVGATGTTVQNSIATLAVVASQNRQPNMFELLQAGILQGSLGLAPQQAGGSVQRTMIGTDPGLLISANQIVQIGANLIDQSDADSYPSRIYFNNTEFCGSENIPYINKVTFASYRPTGMTNGVSRGLIKGWFEFEMWNPYVGSADDAPASFRIRLQSGPSGGGVSKARMLYDIYTAVPPGSQQVASFPAAGDGRSITVNMADLSAATADPQTLTTLRLNGAMVTGIESDDVYDESSAPGAAHYTGIWVGDYALGGSAQINQPFSMRPSINPNPGTQPLYFVLEYDYGSAWVTVQKFTNGSAWTELNIVPPEGNNVAANSNNFTSPNIRHGCLSGPDPRTLRFGFGNSGRTSAVSAPADPNLTPFWDKTQAWNPVDQTQLYRQARGPSGPNFLPNISVGSFSPSRSNYRFADNRGTGGTSDPIYYDRDGVQRFGDALWNTSDLSRGVFPMSPMASRPQDRPIILNRPFQTVSEMGYAFRDLPFRSLDFSTEKSADGGLLDLFCVQEGEENGLVAGRVDLNTQNPYVLRAILTGATRTVLDPANNQLSSADAAAIATAIMSLTSTGASPSPFLNKEELALRLGPDASLTDVINFRKEAIIGALAAVGQTRTWNLLIDVIAQSGRLTPASDGLNDFVVEGERRYWLHIAIDRYTGEVLATQLEPVPN